MEENAMLPLDEFLKIYGFEGEFTEKEKFQILGRIIDYHEVDKDWEDLKYSKIPDTDKTSHMKDEYASTIRNLDIKIMNAKRYYYILDAKFKKERKLKRKQVFQKVLGKFKINK